MLNAQLSLATQDLKQQLGEHKFEYTRLLAFLVVAQCALTIVHHLYGEFFLYQDGVRLHAAIGAPLALALTFVPFLLHRTTAALRMFTFWTVTIWVFTIGLFEGFWNHILVDLIALMGMTESYSSAFVRAIPGDAIFEFTGIAQFFVAGAMIYFIHKIYRQRTD